MKSQNKLARDNGLSLLEAFEALPNPHARECMYQLEELLLATICAAISEAENCPSVVEWSEKTLDRLGEPLPFTTGIALHDT